MGGGGEWDVWCYVLENSSYEIHCVTCICTVTPRVVVQLSGDQISVAKASELVSVVNNNANALSLQVRNVAAGNRIFLFFHVYV